MTLVIGKPPTSMYWCGGKRSFSFVELLVATAILSIGMVIILQALSVTSRVAGLTFDIVNATFLGENKMQEWEFWEKRGEIDRQPEENEGTVGKFGFRYALNLNRDLQLYHLNFNITWKRANRQEETNLNTYLR